MTRRFLQLARPLKAVTLLLAATLLLGGCAAGRCDRGRTTAATHSGDARQGGGDRGTNESSNYTHKESRAAWTTRRSSAPRTAYRRGNFRVGIREAKFFEDLDAAPSRSPAINAIFEPRIEQYSFANAKETGGSYCAVTIRYQIFIYAPDGQQVDMLTLTGYGSGPAPKIGNGEEELGIATYAAMRDAAAKFLTQFPGLDVAKPLLASQALTPKSAPAPGSAEEAAAASQLTIEALPINETPVGLAPRRRRRGTGIAYFGSAACSSGSEPPSSRMTSPPPAASL